MKITETDALLVAQRVREALARGMPLAEVAALGAWYIAAFEYEPPRLGKDWRGRAGPGQDGATLTRWLRSRSAT
jgi:hypothetical protein